MLDIEYSELAISDSSLVLGVRGASASDKGLFIGH